MARQKLIHRRTNVAGKLPIVSGTSDEALNYGELAINYATDNELLIIRNANNGAVTFSPTAYINNNLNKKVSWGGDTNGAKKTIGSIDNYDIGFITNNTEQVTITSGGNVGIGTNAPVSKLQLGSGNFYMPLDSYIRFGQDVSRFGKLPSGNNYGFYTTTKDFEIQGWNGSAFTQFLHINTNGTSANGNVGIGTTSPTAQVSQKSTLALESAPLGSELTNASNWTLTSGWTGDYVTGFTHTSGAGVTALSRAMAINTGSLYQISWTVTNRTTGSFTISLGGQTSTDAFTSTGSFGPKTLNNTGPLVFTPTSDFNGTISLVSVKENTGPYGATYDIQDNTGVSTIEIRSSLNSLSNTFIGKNAGSRNTTGYYNSFIGYSAGRNNTTGYNNSFIGYAAGTGNLTGYNNCFIGYSAGLNNTTGYYNSFIGYAAGLYNTTGYNNSIIGTYAGLYNTTGYYNSFIGVSAGQGNTSGSYNTFIGLSAGQGNTTGYYNSFIGVSAGQGNTTGSYNTAIGRNAGRYLADGTTGRLTGNNDLYLGADTKASADGTDNENVLGYGAIGAGSNSVVLGNDSITKTLLKGNVGIGTTSPTAQISQKSTLDTESAQLGGEITNASNWTLTSGWSGDYTNGFTHTAGAGVTPLSRTMTISTGSLYQISWTVKNRTAGSFTVSLGGQTSTDAFTSTGSFGPKTLNSTGDLIITPTTDFNGTISNISVKENTGAYGATYNILDNTGVSTLEIRSSLNSLNNTFIGKNAGSRNTTGFYNSFIGGNAGQNNTIGSYNSFIGSYAGQNNTTGSYNSFIGSYAGQNNTTGTNNSFIGVNAGQNNTTGSFNTAIGRSAGQNNTTGIYNSFIGMFAGLSNTTGNYNSFFGSYAGYHNTTGSYNSFIGLNAGRYIADGVTGRLTGNNGLYLGYNTKASADGTDNENVLGYGAIGAGSNSVVLGNSAITKTLLNGNVGVGFSSPLSKVSINGGLHVGGESDAGDNNILADGTITGSNLSGTNTGDETAIRLGSLGATIYRGEWIYPVDEVDTVNYYQNDIIYYNSNNYICILNHTSFNNERILPDNIIYWKLLSTLDYNNMLNLPPLEYLGLDGGSMNTTDLITNLNADLLDGKHASAFSLTGHTHDLSGKENSLSGNTTSKTTPVDADTIVISDSAASSATKKLSFSNLKTYLNGVYSITTHTHRRLYGSNGTYTVVASDEASNTKFLEVYCNGSYIYMIGNSTNGTACNMVFQANNAGQIAFNTAGGGPIILQTNGSGATYINTPDFVINSNNHIQTDASSSVINKLPTRAGRLMVEERITISQSDPSGGIDGDIWITY